MEIEAFGDILMRHGLKHGAGVPCSFFKPLVNYMTAEPDLDYLPAASEGEAVAIASGLIAGGKPSFALMQNSGLGNAINPLTSLVYIYKIPLVVLVSHRAQPGLSDEPQHELMGRITEQLSSLCGLRTHVLVPEELETTLGAARVDEAAAAWIVRKGTLEGGPKAPPIAPRFESRPVTPEATGAYEPSLRREQALAAILPLLNRGLGDQSAPMVTSTTGKLSRELFELDDREHDKRNRFYMVGSMGCAAGFGLGTARARPDKKAVVLDGDGAVIMKMGTLATVGGLAPKNFHQVVFDNAAYESTGSQPTTSPAVDFAAAALACGYRAAATVAEADALVDAFERHLSSDGPTLLRVAVRTGSRKDLGRPTLKPRPNWERFCAYARG